MPIYNTADRLFDALIQAVVIVGYNQVVQYTVLQSHCVISITDLRSRCNRRPVR